MNALLKLTGVMVLAATSVAFALPQTGTFHDNGDGHTYRTVNNVTRTWMAENLPFNVNWSACYDTNN